MSGKLMKYEMANGNRNDVAIHKVKGAQNDWLRSRKRSGRYTVVFESLMYLIAGMFPAALLGKISLRRPNASIMIWITLNVRGELSISRSLSLYSVI